MLYINFRRGDEPTLYMSDINLLLGKKIPAHIQYQAAVTYHFPVGVGVRRRHYRYGYDLCGTKPDIAMLGALFKRTTVTEARQSSYGTEHTQPSEHDTLTGVKPDIVTIASLQAVESVVEAQERKYTNEYRKASDGQQEAGKWPQETAIGDRNGINAGTEVKATDYGVDYIYCGTGYSQS